MLYFSAIHGSYPYLEPNLNSVDIDEPTCTDFAFYNPVHIAGSKSTESTAQVLVSITFCTVAVYLPNPLTCHIDLPRYIRGRGGGMPSKTKTPPAVRRAPSS